MLAGSSFDSSFQQWAGRVRTLNWNELSCYQCVVSKWSAFTVIYLGVRAPSHRGCSFHLRAMHHRVQRQPIVLDGQVLQLIAAPAQAFRDDLPR